MNHHKIITLLVCTTFSLAATVCLAADSNPLVDKTLVVWAAPADLTQRGGSALTIDANGPDRFDAIVFGELSPRTWMPGSNAYTRTDKNQSAWPKETASPNEFVQIAIVYKGSKITLFRNGEQYTQYKFDGQPHSFGSDSIIMFGPRHKANQRDRFVGRIKDARIYDRALTQPMIAAMKPGEAIADVEAWAWWDFADTGTYDKARRFTKVELSGDARIEDGVLVLGKEEAGMTAFMASDASLTAKAAIPGSWTKSGPVPGAALQSARLLREKLIEDPYRPTYHFACPEDNARPGDPNGCFYANGRYHLMYLYNRNGVGFCWGHISSSDLVHWQHHPDSVGPGDGDEGCFSGGGFVDDDGKAYLSFWMLWGDKGIGIAESSDRNYSNWKKLEENPVIKSTSWGITETTDKNGKPIHYGSADPSNIWKKDGRYYMLAGNLLLLNKFGRKKDSPPEEQGDCLYLFVSDDLKEWDYLHRFYERNPKWTERSEDNMCPSFLPLPSSPDGGKASDKYLMLFISHNKGCQYYVGNYDTKADKFIADNHGRMTWVDNTFFAPEALIDGKGRQIAWSWLTDNHGDPGQTGWSGVYGLPRSLWLGEDGTVRMRPVKELEMLRSNPKSWDDIVLKDGSKILDGVPGDSCELELTIDPKVTAKQFGVKVRASAGGEEETLLYFDAENKKLVFDSTKSGIAGRKKVEQAPFELKPGEPLVLRVFVDKSVVEIYANDRQAICRRVYPGRGDSLGLVLFAEDGKAEFTSVKAWEMMPANPY
ncbi:MAG: GH32 C-terminal domain-containing protein [Kiritimatiellia bacterium]|jgi:beta-fructofuranosidase|nr:GH32 C-terminal domain-containing protein [Kiritimatiellia bacterium]MDP6847263.1 GH32 C-terminal domain-containing protein [Kiritimatiellia bacterium]